MSIVSIRILNFKSIENIELNFVDEKSVSCFLGKNGVGKSNIFAALNYFYMNLEGLNSNKIVDSVNNYNSHCEISIVYDVSGFENKVNTEYNKELFNDLLKLSKEHKSCWGFGKIGLSKIRVTLKQDKQGNILWNQNPKVRKIIASVNSTTIEGLLINKQNVDIFIEFCLERFSTDKIFLERVKNIDEEIFALLGDIVDKPYVPDRISTRQRLHCYKSPNEYETREYFRKWVVSCVETNKIRFELYGVLNNPSHQSLLAAISNKIMCDFGEQNSDSCLFVDIIQKEIGDIAMPVNKYDKVQRCDEIKDKLGETEDVVACICIIPGADADEYKDDRDPKQIIRNAFARSGRVVQFVVASTEEDVPNNQKIEHAVYDLYRQLGITTLMDTEQLKSYKLKDITCVGMHVCTQIHNIRKKTRFMPLYVSHELSTGRTRVQCAAFEENNVSYRKACLEMAKLFWNEDFEQLCVNSSFSPAKQKLIEMRNRFDAESQGAVLLVHSDGNTRPLWGGISDKTISGYTAINDYMPDQIDAGSNKTPYPISLSDTGVRIFRVRNNAEVPDYYTSEREDENYSSASGIFKYGKVFWAISQKPNDPKYNRSLKESRFSYPFADYAEKDMIEIYPLQLQLEDDPSVWTKYIMDLCSLAIQYDQSTILPLPLHLASALEEYLLEINN